MRKLSFLLLIFGLVAIGCDSNDDGGDGNGTTDAERFEGAWALTEVSDGNGMVDLSANFNSVVVTFNGDGSFSMAIDAVEGGTDLNLSGTFTVVEDDNGITLNATVPGVGTIPLAFTYLFFDNQVSLTAGAQTTAALNGVLGTTLTAPSVFVVSPV